MTVIEFAEKRLNESCINDDDEAVLYWRAYLDGARAQKCDQPETCTAYVSVITNADRIRAMSDEELAKFLTHIDPTNCQDCAFSRGWRCQPDRDDYSDFEKCEEGRKRWLKQPAEGE